jgi:hypothetical protein
MALEAVRQEKGCQSSSPAIGNRGAARFATLAICIELLAIFFLEEAR